MVKVLFLFGLDPRCVGNPRSNLRSDDSSRLDCLFFGLDGLFERDRLSRWLIWCVIILNWLPRGPAPCFACRLFGVPKEPNRSCCWFLYSFSPSFVLLSSLFSRKNGFLDERCPTKNEDAAYLLSWKFCFFLRWLYLRWTCYTLLTIDFVLYLVLRSSISLLHLFTSCTSFIFICLSYNIIFLWTVSYCRSPTSNFFNCSLSSSSSLESSNWWLRLTLKSIIFWSLPKKLLPFPGNYIVESFALSPYSTKLPVLA